MSTDPKDHAISISEMLKMLSNIEDIQRPELAYRRDPAGERLKDLKKGRGVVSINPDMGEELTMFHGHIVDKDGIEYRVLVDPVLRGARTTCPETGQREVAAGYWISPMMYEVPKFDVLIPVRVDPDMPDNEFRIEQKKDIEDA